MRMVEKQNGTPKASAARAARISPSACCMPQSPVGARATGMATSSPIIVDRTDRFSMFTATRCRKQIAASSRSLARYVHSVQEAKLSDNRKAEVELRRLPKKTAQTIVDG